MASNLAAALLVPVLTVLTGGPVDPEPIGTPVRVVSHDVPQTAAQREQVLRYWTLDRMIHAAPPPGPARGFRKVVRLSAAVSSSSSPGALWPAQAPARNTVGAASGKVFFSMSGRDYVCSAATVASANRDVVVTAGHCAKNGTGAWATNWIFVPGYRDGSGPYGGFTARRMYVPDQWSGAANDDDDVAMVAVGTTGGRHVQDAAGAEAIAFGGPRGREVYAFGYPAEGRYDGERLAYCSGRPHDDPRGLTSSQGLHCDMTQGSSGGAWLAGFDPATGTGTVVSVSSFKYADDGTTMYGPYFGTTVRRLYDQAQRG
ncbi:MAG: hypothetical protein JWN00_2844 [Actinomycetia bacterium]|jgi:hypothetical protein|nr:hypothetical protein [Actinomycetes bacterium]